MLFAYTNPALGAVPIAQWTVGAFTTITQNFGSGLECLQVPVVGGNPSNKCFLAGSSTTQTFTATSITQWNMKAWNI